MIGHLLCHSAAVCQKVVDKIWKRWCVDRAEYETMQHVMFFCSQYTSESKSFLRELSEQNFPSKGPMYNIYGHIFA